MERTKRHLDLEPQSDVHILQSLKDIASVLPKAGELSLTSLLKYGSYFLIKLRKM